MTCQLYLVRKDCLSTGAVSTSSKYNNNIEYQLSSPGIHVALFLAYNQGYYYMASLQSQSCPELWPY